MVTASWSIDPSARAYRVEIRDEAGKILKRPMVRPHQDEKSGNNTIDITVANLGVDPAKADEYRVKTVFDDWSSGPYSGWSDLAGTSSGGAGGSGGSGGGGSGGSGGGGSGGSGGGSGGGTSSSAGQISWTIDPDARAYRVEIRDDAGKVIKRPMFRPHHDEEGGNNTIDVTLSTYGVDPADAAEFRVKTIYQDWSSGKFSGWSDIADTSGGGSGGGGSGGGGSDGGGGSGGGGHAGNLDLMILGDSFTVPWRDFPDHLDAALDSRGHDVDIIKYAKSGDDAGEALKRLKNYFSKASNEDPELAIVALGTNDVLDQRSFSDIARDLGDILDIFDREDVEVVLAKPASYYPHREKPFKGYPEGSSQDQQYDALFQDLVREHDVVFESNFHAGLQNESLLQSDGLHPNSQGTARMVQNVMPEIEDLIESAVVA